MLGCTGAPSFFMWVFLYVLFSLPGNALGSQFPLREYNHPPPPAPENPGKLPKNYNLAHPRPARGAAPKITEKLLKSVFF